MKWFITIYVSSDITSELRFENLKANLHVYDNDRDTFFGDRDNLTVALYRGYNRMTMFGKKSMRECEVLSLYDAQQALKSKDQLTNYKALGKLRSPLMDKVRKRFTDYLNRLFPALVGVDISVVASVLESSETTSSVVPSSVRITGGLANININVDCNNDDAVNDEYDSDDDDVPAENVADDVSNDDNDDSVDEDDMDGEVEEESDDNDDSVDEDDMDGEVEEENDDNDDSVDEDDKDGGAEVVSVSRYGRKRNELDRLTSAPELYARNKSSKKRLLSKVSSPPPAAASADATSDDIEFIYLD